MTYVRDPTFSTGRFDFPLPGGSPRVRKFVSIQWMAAQIAVAPDLHRTVNGSNDIIQSYSNRLHVDKGPIFKAESTITTTHPPAHPQYENFVTTI